MVGHLLLYKLIILSGGLPPCLLEAEDFKWWATLPMYYKLMFIWLTLLSLYSISQRGGQPLIPISVVPTVVFDRDCAKVTNVFLFSFEIEEAHFH